MTGWLRRLGVASSLRRSHTVAGVVAISAVAFHGALALLVPTGRFLKYPLAAQRWLAGELDVERWIDFSPLLFHVAVIAERIGDSAVLLPWAQSLLVGVSCGLTFLILEPRFGRPAAVASASVLALDRDLVLYGRLVEPEVWLLSLLLAALVCLDRHRHLAAGMALALGVAVRPTVLPLALLVPVWLALRPEPHSQPGKESRTRRRWVRQGAVVLAPCLVMLVAMAWRAEHATGSWRTPSMNPGTVFFEGNQPASRGVSAEYPPAVRALATERGLSGSRVPDPAHVDYRRVARAERPDASVAEVNDFWLRKALVFVADEPATALRRTAAKLVYAFHGFAWHDVPEAWRYDLRLPPLPHLPFGALASLALLGMAIELGRWRHSLLLYALVGCQLAVMLVFYVSARQRLILLPALVYFAAAAVGYLFDRTILVRRRRLAGALAAALCLALLLPTDSMRAETHRRQSWLRGQSVQKALGQAVAAGDAHAAARWGERLVAIAGRHLDGLRPPGASTARAAAELAEVLASGTLDAVAAREVRIDAAWLWLDAGRPAEALAVLATSSDGSAPASWVRARALALGSDRDRALRVLDAAIARHPGHLELLAEWHAIQDSPLDAASTSLERYWSRTDAGRALGFACFAHGRSDSARRALAPVVEAFPELRAEAIRLAIADAESGELERGAERLVAAYASRPLPVVEPDRASEVLRRWRAAHADDPRVASFVARALPLLRVPDADPTIDERSP